MAASGCHRDRSAQSALAPSLIALLNTLARLGTTQPDPGQPCADAPPVKKFCPVAGVIETGGETSPPDWGKTPNEEASPVVTLQGNQPPNRETNTWSVLLPLGKPLSWQTSQLKDYARFTEGETEAHSNCLTCPRPCSKSVAGQGGERLGWHPDACWCSRRLALLRPEVEVREGGSHPLSV